MVVGCAAVGPEYSEVTLQDTTRALVLIYRPHPPMNPFLTNTFDYTTAPDIYHEERKIAGLNVGGYTYVEIEPGETEFSAREKLTGQPMTTLPLNAVAGETYFVRYLFTMGLTEQTFDLRVMPVDIGRAEIRKTRYMKANQ